MQARVEFFTKRLVNQALTRHARKPFKRGRDEAQTIMRFPARARASVASVIGGIVVQFKRNRRELCLNRRLYALGAGKMCFLLCQFLVRLTVGAHTERSNVRRLRV